MIMGREIRMVPANWEHPTQECPHLPWAGGCDEAKANNGRCFLPVYDEPYEHAAQEWLNECIAWSNRTATGFDGNPVDEETYREHQFYWDYAGKPPNKESYRPQFDQPATHYQVYETVSEGTPVTPHFATHGELIEYLIEHGDFWSQRRGDGGWDRVAAERFVLSEWDRPWRVSSGRNKQRKA